MVPACVRRELAFGTGFSSLHVFYRVFYRFANLLLRFWFLCFLLAGLGLRSVLKAIFLDPDRCNYHINSYILVGLTSQMSDQLGIVYILVTYSHPGPV